MKWTLSESPWQMDLKCFDRVSEDFMAALREHRIETMRLRESGGQYFSQGYARAHSPIVCMSFERRLLHPMRGVVPLVAAT